jgi:hypothetical protein
MKKQFRIHMFLLILCAATAFAQSVLNNDSITKMAKAGLGDDVIVSMIKSQPGSYAVDPDSVIQLKKAGLSEKVIAAMIEKTSAGSAPSPAPAAATAKAPPTPVTANENSPDYPLKAHIVSEVHPKDGPIPGPPLRCAPPRLGETMIQIGNVLYTAECRHKEIEIGQDYPAQLYEKSISLLFNGKAISYRVRDKQESVKP